MPITMTETEYRRNLELITTQVEFAIDSFYTEREINIIASEQPAIFRKLNRDAAFWNLLLRSLQSEFLMTLGRIFDVNNDALSIHKVLSATVTHAEYFSKTALRARKVAESHGIPDWLDDFINSAWEPTASDLRALKKAAAPYNARFEGVYRPIRNNVFGHNIVTDSGKVSELFEKAAIKEIDEILYFLRDLTQVLFGLFFNGTKPELGQTNDGYKQRVRETVQTVLLDLAHI